MSDTTSIQAFRVAVPDDTLERIRINVAGYNWHEMPDDGGWAYGTNLDYMKELCAYWLEEFDWRAQGDGNRIRRRRDRAACGQVPCHNGLAIGPAAWAWKGLSVRRGLR